MTTTSSINPAKVTKSLDNKIDKNMSGGLKQHPWLLKEPLRIRAL